MIKNETIYALVRSLRLRTKMPERPGIIFEDNTDHVSQDAADLIELLCDLLNSTTNALEMSTGELHANAIKTNRDLVPAVKPSSEWKYQKWYDGHDVLEIGPVVTFSRISAEDMPISVLESIANDKS